MGNKIIQLKVTEEEKEEIESIAKSLSLPTATFCRVNLLQQIRQEDSQ